MITKPPNPAKSQVDAREKSTYDEPPPDQCEPFEMPEGERKEWTAKPADSATLKARGYASDFVSAFLTLIEKSKPQMRDGSDFPFEDEALRMYLTLIELGKKAEIQAERMGVIPGQVRRFYCPDFIAELHYRRATLPFNLSPEEKEKERRKLARAWRLRFRRVIHDRQRRTHLGFVEREKREKNDKRKATVYVDRLSDVVNHAAQLIRRKKKGVQIKRAALAADEALRAFINTPEHIYAPDWTEPEESDEGKTLEQSTTDALEEVDPFEAIRRTLAQCVKDARKLVEARTLDEQEADALRDELHALIETAWTDSPRPQGAPLKRPSVVSPFVLDQGDIEEKPAEVVTSPSSCASQKGDLVGRSTTPLNSAEVPKTLGNLALSPKMDVQKRESPAHAAHVTVEAMRSVGADRFKVVYLGCVPVGGQAECVGSEEIKPDVLLSKVGELVERSEKRGQSVTLRAWGGALIQVDDCSREVVERLRPFAFLVIETSPGSYQVWLALAPDIGDASRKAIRDRLLRKFKDNGEEANGGAYNSLRLPGCLNAKEKYRQVFGSFPRVALIYVALGRICSSLELEQAGLLAAPIERPKPPIIPSTAKLPTGAMPDYNNYLSDAGGDRSRADIRWAMASLGAGFPHYAVVSQLEAMSGKAQGRRDDYARKTVENAAAFVAASSVTRAGRERVTL